MPKVKKWYHDINSRTFWSVVDYESPSDDRKGCCGQGHGNDGNNDYQNKESYKDARKCFKGGLVRASLMRYDESGGALNWATGINFWKMKFDNPKAPGSSQAGYSPNDIEGKCGTIMSHGQEFHPGMAESPDGGCSYGVDGAFVLNCYSQMNEECYWVVNDLIKRYGTATDSCAEYFCKGENETIYDQTKFGIKFVPCPNRNWDPAQ